MHDTVLSENFKMPQLFTLLASEFPSPIILAGTVQRINRREFIEGRDSLLVGI